MKKKKNQRTLNVIAHLTASKVVTIRMLVITSVFILGVTFAKAQVLAPFVIVSSGNSDVGADCIVNWTLGEIVGNTMSQSTAILTQGFQQYFSDIAIKSEEIETSPEEEFSAFPIPAKDFLNLTIKHPAKDKYLVEVFNIKGAKVLSIQVNQKAENEKINISNLANGVYALKIIGTLGKTIKIIKFVKQ
jgi:hypothetical protein